MVVILTKIGVMFESNELTDEECHELALHLRACTIEHIGKDRLNESESIIMITQEKVSVSEADISQFILEEREHDDRQN